ncbi:MAG TPA: alpha/beta hydrolase [Kofleriaceae bacterium]|nr:alpha/beta hydrolase [Kofleriaceae bacterium]
MTRAQRVAIDALLRRPRPRPRDVAELRTGFATLMSQMRIAEGVRRSDTTLAGRRAVLVEAARAQRPGTILYLHGGSGVIGSPETAMCLTAALVARTGVRALSLDYRLAPEHPFPAGLDDVLAAYRALLDGGAEAESVVVAGDSAGGGLAVGALLLARDAGVSMPAAVVAFSGGFDYTRTGASMDGKAGQDPLFTRDSLGVTAAMYLGGAEPDQPLLSPATRADLRGFPPMLLQVGTNELLLDDSTRLAARACAAGVDVVLDITADAPHVFQAFTGLLDEADEALDRAALFLSQRLGRAARPPADVVSLAR